MGSSPQPPTASPEFLAVFRAQAGARSLMSFERFMELCLYHPEVGYYRQDRERVGYGRGTDFFTASTSGPIFGELVAAACAKRLRDHWRDPSTHTFVEIGAEGAGVLTGVTHPFAATRVIRVGAPLALTGNCVVFSNELFDAQPCVRTVYRQGRWHERGVALQGDSFQETDFEPASREFNEPGAEGYQFDRPYAATALAARIAAEPWRGLFVAIDYGKTFRELAEETPGGTLRAYFRHAQTNDLLARPGEQDLTCHVCWDWLADALARQRFAEPKLEFQETFFVRHAGEWIAAASAADATRLSPRKLALQQLLHPSQLGQKFQVLHALR